MRISVVRSALVVLLLVGLSGCKGRSWSWSDLAFWSSSDPEPQETSGLSGITRPPEVALGTQVRQPAPGQGLINHAPTQPTNPNSQAIRTSWNTTPGRAGLSAPGAPTGSLGARAGAGTIYGTPQNGRYGMTRPSPTIPPTNRSSAPPMYGAPTAPGGNLGNIGLPPRSTTSNPNSAFTPDRYRTQPNPYATGTAGIGSLPPRAPSPTVNPYSGMSAVGTPPAAPTGSSFAPNSTAPYGIRPAPTNTTRPTTPASPWSPPPSMSNPTSSLGPSYPPPAGGSLPPRSGSSATTYPPLGSSSAVPSWSPPAGIGSPPASSVPSRSPAMKAPPFGTPGLPTYPPVAPSASYTRPNPATSYAPGSTSYSTPASNLPPTAPGSPSMYPPAKGPY